VGGVWELVYFIPLYHLPGALFVRTLRTLSRLLNRSTSWLSTVESELICPFSSGCCRRTKYGGILRHHLIYQYWTAGLNNTLYRVRPQYTGDCLGSREPRSLFGGLAEVWGWRGSGVRDYCLESYNNSQSTGNHKTTKFCFLYLSSG